MIKIITAVNNPKLNEELKKENNIKIIGIDIQYKEGILELLENNKEIDYIIIDEKLPGEIQFDILIEKISEKNKKIKIIILIKKENKEKINIKNKNLIKIYYEKEINLYKLKNYNNLENISEKNNIKNRSKIINFFGESQVGKSLTILNISNFLSNQNYKVLIIGLNSEKNFFNMNFKLKIKNIENKKIKNKIKSKEYEKYKIKYINKKILNKLIIKINKNIDLIFYNKIINLNLINYLEKNYNYICIENNIKNKKLINNFEENILIIRPNLLGIKNGKRIIEKNKLTNNFKILINNYNKNSIDENIIKNIFNKNKVLGKIDYQIEYEKIINSSFTKININSKKYNEDLKLIVDFIIKK